MLKGKKIILGISAGIAAYKAAALTRLLIKQGAEVKVIMTEKAKEFITPLTMATLSKNPIVVDFYNPENGDWNSHVDMGLWADAMVIAPATANTMGKMANAIADNLLVTTYLSARCPVFVAPTMDLDMYLHPANQRNLNCLEEDGVHMIEAETGELASGLSGKGRMAEPETIVEELISFFEKQQGVNTAQLEGRTFLVNAGPTYEKIDPVRFIGNFSSGKMGYSIAEELASRGAKVILVSGPTSEKAKHANIEVKMVTSAQDMYEACANVFPNCDGAVLSAAVADYTPVVCADQKVKSDKDEMVVALKATVDIAQKLGEIKRDGQMLVGFALETQNAVANAQKKLKQKNLDFIVLNSLENEGAGFGYDTNKISIIDNDNNKEEFSLKSKREVAIDIVNKIVSL
ncbi:bifunctional phosphopantothenoylcysteine decarboxylase/phosphopantothenate--cysteine ligase CoaBC [Plebeiibacterium sediminum]|uniref:Coenzyme A biosynthesis bifunctional protein CoaBC n=1 Tax=Plebeiibacterium sediminum TaxID=2992112 RepID=A0AAE3SFM3_9BACT|nr:bifunctional phosphopantothenoylcysteine decarboxylase/phosphopantothenate--cysteine ligase CoaBC [Plebeiobacterium sediminum]MCW3787247.1 bifunctional phosphopantothenoylcysteine decarboxylase/phosphopantothenate--cysteine ligase CoaBC [Plebeiobacterium sediminum]